MSHRNLRARLADWRRLVAVSPRRDDPQVVGGRVAEEYLQCLIQAHRQFRGATLYPNRRVPAGRRRREIDLIVVSPHRLHLIEVKNWSGSLKLDRGQWVQLNRNGLAIRHPDLVNDHRDKADALFGYLDREGVRLTPDQRKRYASNKVLFVNPKLQIESSVIADHPDVLPSYRLDRYLSAQRRDSFGERLLGSIAQWCLDSDSASTVLDGLLGRLPPDMVARVNAALGKLGTWDSLHFHGGRIETGDLIRLDLGGRTADRNQFGRDIAMKLHWTRNRWWGLAKALWGERLGVLETGVSGLGWVELDLADNVLFHKAGEPNPTPVPLASLDEIRLG